jgi:hypothetical protein
MSKCRCRRRTRSTARSTLPADVAPIATGYLPDGAHAKLLILLGVPVVGRLQVERINCHHFDRRSRLSRRQDHGRNSAVNGKRQSIDQFLVGDHLVVARWQSSINCLQKEGVDERQRFAVCFGNLSPIASRTSTSDLPIRSLAAANPPMSGTVSRSQTIDS